MKEEIKCPECGGDGVSQTIGCCNNPRNDGSCCGHGIPVYEPCEACQGKRSVTVTDKPIKD